jgi:ferric-dicitrate binding protein FerR (iron transport regulator)
MSSDFRWPGTEQLEREIELVNREERRRVAERRRRHRREWLQEGLLALLIVGTGIIFFWVLSGQTCAGL